MDHESSPPSALVAIAGDAPLAHAPLPAGQVIEGAPTTASVELGALGEVSYGLWEITPGVSTDVEAEEAFVVLTGRGTLEFVEPAGASIDLVPGAIVRLTAGAHTRWTITETLRKLYIA